MTSATVSFGFCFPATSCCPSIRILTSPEVPSASQNVSGLAVPAARYLGEVKASDLQVTAPKSHDRLIATLPQSLLPLSVWGLSAAVGEALLGICHVPGNLAPLSAAGIRLIVCEFYKKVIARFTPHSSCLCCECSYLK